MTREEAIKELKQFSGTTQLRLSANFWTAHNMTIKALEQMPSEDCVSRKAVLDMCKKEIDHISKNWQNYHSPSEAKSGFEYIAKNIYDLPPVTPVRKKGKWIIDDKEYGIIWHCHCSNCKRDPQDYIGGTENWWLVRLPDYCPNCGAEMEDEE